MRRRWSPSCLEVAAAATRRCRGWSAHIPHDWRSDTRSPGGRRTVQGGGGTAALLVDHLEARTLSAAETRRVMVVDADPAIRAVLAVNENRPLMRSCCRKGRTAEDRCSGALLGRVRADTRAREERLHGAGLDAHARATPGAAARTPRWRCQGGSVTSFVALTDRGCGSARCLSRRKGVRQLCGSPCARPGSQS